MLKVAPGFYVMYVYYLILPKIKSRAYAHWQQNLSSSRTAVMEQEYTEWVKNCLKGWQAFTAPPPKKKKAHYSTHSLLLLYYW